jgi:ketosteroid isomerase-like protein
MKLYASDGVFMPQNFPSSVGADAVRRAHDTVFRAIKLSVKFNVAGVSSSSGMGVRSHQFGGKRHDQRYWRQERRSQSGTLRLP